MQKECLRWECWKGRILPFASCWVEEHCCFLQWHSGRDQLVAKSLSKRKRAGLSLSFKNTAKTVQNNASLQMSMGFQALWHSNDFHLQPLYRSPIQRPALLAAAHITVISTLLLIFTIPPPFRFCQPLVFCHGQRSRELSLTPRVLDFLSLCNSHTPACHLLSAFFPTSEL